MLHYSTHQTPGASGQASEGSLGGCKVQTGAEEAPWGKWPGTPQAPVREGTVMVVTVAPLPWREGWEQTKSWASSSVWLSHRVSNTATGPGLKLIEPPAPLGCSTTHSFHTLREKPALPHSPAQTLQAPQSRCLPWLHELALHCWAGSTGPKVLTFSHTYPLGLHSKTGLKTRRSGEVVCFPA